MRLNAWVYSHSTPIVRCSFAHLTTTLRPMAQFLAQNHLLTIFLVVGLGAVLGAIRFGPLRFGAAGALFVGLLVSAYSPQ